jgi:hypothetical protein
MIFFGMRELHVRERKCHDYIPTPADQVFDEPR